MLARKLDASRDEADAGAAASAKNPLKNGLKSVVTPSRSASMRPDLPTALWRPANVNRSQLLNALAERNDMSRREADEVVTSLVDIITETVSTGEDVTISGFAKFRRVDRPARMGRNPATGETIKIAAKRQAKVTPLKAFKDSVLAGKAPRKTAAKKTTAKKTATKKTAARRR
jgi:DNA-binding protein HU-beta